MNTGIVFINGAGLNSTVWDKLKSRLQHPVLTVDFPNRNGGKHANASLTFDDYVNKVVSEIKDQRQENFVLVTHSIGACVGLKAAQAFGNALKGFVAISSVVPKSGQSFASALPFPQKLLLPLLLTLFGTKPPTNRRRPRFAMIFLRRSRRKSSTNSHRKQSRCTQQRLRMICRRQVVFTSG